MPQPKQTKRSVIALKTQGGELTLPLTRALWLVWCIATYPLQMLAGYIFFDVKGLIFVTVLMALQYRGKQ